MQKQFLALSLLLTASCVTAMEVEESENNDGCLSSLLATVFSLNSMEVEEPERECNWREDNIHGLITAGREAQSDEEFDKLVVDFKNKLDLLNPNEQFGEYFKQYNMHQARQMTALERLQDMEKRGVDVSCNLRPKTEKVKDDWVYRAGLMLKILQGEEAAKRKEAPDLEQGQLACTKNTKTDSNEN